MEALNTPEEDLGTGLEYQSPSGLRADIWAACMLVRRYPGKARRYHSTEKRGQLLNQGIITAASAAVLLLNEAGNEVLPQPLAAIRIPEAAAFLPSLSTPKLRITLTQRNRLCAVPWSRRHVT